MNFQFNFVAEPGFEPRFQGYEPCELPLLHSAILLSKNYNTISLFLQIF